MVAWLAHGLPIVKLGVLRLNRTITLVTEPCCGSVHMAKWLSMDFGRPLDAALQDRAYKCTSILWWPCVSVCRRKISQELVWYLSTLLLGNTPPPPIWPKEIWFVWEKTLQAIIRVGNRKCMQFLSRSTNQQKFEHIAGIHPATEWER